MRNTITEYTICASPSAKRRKKTRKILTDPALSLSLFWLNLIVKSSGWIGIDFNLGGPGHPKWYRTIVETNVFVYLSVCLFVWSLLCVSLNFLWNVSVCVCMWMRSTEHYANEFVSHRKSSTTMHSNWSSFEKSTQQNEKMEFITFFGCR